jgi:hypothetical protein
VDRIALEDSLPVPLSWPSSTTTEVLEKDRFGAATDVPVLGGLLAEACGSRTHHPGREGQDQWL